MEDKSIFIKSITKINNSFSPLPNHIASFRMAGILSSRDTYRDIDITKIARREISSRHSSHRSSSHLSRRRIALQLLMTSSKLNLSDANVIEKILKLAEKTEKTEILNNLLTSIENLKKTNITFRKQELDKQYSNLEKIVYEKYQVQDNHELEKKIVKEKLLSQKKDDTISKALLLLQARSFHLEDKDFDLLPLPSGSPKKSS